MVCISIIGTLNKSIIESPPPPKKKGVSSTGTGVSLGFEHLTWELRN